MSSGVRRENKMNILKKYRYYSIVIITALVLLISATVHRFQLNISNSLYTNNILIPIEMFSMIAIMLFTLVNVIILITNLIKRNWKQLLIIFCVIIISIVLMIISMNIDAPTLIYMT